MESIRETWIGYEKQVPFMYLSVSQPLFYIGDFLTHEVEQQDLAS